LELQLTISEILQTLYSDLSIQIGHDNLAGIIEPTKPKKWRIGLISSNFFNHSIGRILLETLRALNRLRSQYGDIELYIVHIDQSVVKSSASQSPNGGT
jgi:predicted O-linked N-acetylglucosamine transferase (SPINDLY family)